jgi:predicted nucleotidyltransferase
MNKEILLQYIKKSIHELEPTAEIILYGSRARHQGTPESDWDLLILLDGQVNDERIDNIRHRLYELEWEHDEVLCSVIRSREEWDSARYNAMPFHQNVVRDGIVL